MRILMTQRQLIHRAGSEMFTLEVAAELSRRGHKVAIFCPRTGELAKLAFAAGAVVKSALADLPWVPDIIHGQHHLQTVAALSFFANVPAIYYCHGVMPWVEQVPLHRRIRKYVMMCGWMVTPLATEFGIPPERVTAIPNFVDVRRFSEVRRPPPRPQRALLFGNSPLPANELSRLESACHVAGIFLTKVGEGYGNPQPRPEIVLPDYDLVFAVGKCAIEALACGCAVVPIIPGLAGQLVDLQNFDQWIFSNFSPRYYTSATQISVERLQRQLGKYSPAAMSQLCERVRTEHTLLRAVDALERVYEGASEPMDEIGLETEFAPYLERLSLEVDEMWSELEQRRQLEHSAQSEHQVQPEHPVQFDPPAEQRSPARPVRRWQRYARSLSRLAASASRG